MAKIFFHSAVVYSIEDVVERWWELYYTKIWHCTIEHYDCEKWNTNTPKVYRTHNVARKLLLWCLWHNLSQHGGCWWPGAYLAPGHLQPSWWQRQIGGCYILCSNIIQWFGNISFKICVAFRFTSNVQDILGHIMKPITYWCTHLCSRHSKSNVPHYHLQNDINTITNCFKISVTDCDKMVHTKSNTNVSFRIETTQSLNILQSSVSDCNIMIHSKADMLQQL